LGVDAEGAEGVGTLDFEGNVDALPGGGLVDLTEGGTRDGFRREALKQRLLLSKACAVVAGRFLLPNVSGQLSVPVIEGFLDHRVGTTTLLPLLVESVQY